MWCKMKKGIKAETLNLRQIISLKSFREPKEVLVNEAGYAECPTCHAAGHLDYVRYCSHCGQRLTWNAWYKAVAREEVWDLFRKDFDTVYQCTLLKDWNIMEYVLKLNKDKAEQFLNKLDDGTNL